MSNNYQFPVRSICLCPIRRSNENSISYLHDHYANNVDQYANRYDG